MEVWTQQKASCCGHKKTKQVEGTLLIATGGWEVGERQSWNCSLARSYFHNELTHSNGGLLHLTPVIKFSFTWHWQNSDLGHI